MKKLSNISESIWGDVRRRAEGQSIRQEDGRKVHTCLGVDVVLKNPDCDYDTLIKDLINGDAQYHSEYGVGIVSPKDLNLTPEEMANVRKWEAPYTYLIYDGQHGTSLIANFWSYKEILDFELDNDFEENYLEEDYISICRCVATKLKEVGDCFQYVPRNKAYILDLDARGDDVDKYTGECQLLLIDEGDVYSWVCDHNEEYDNPFGNTYLDDFKEGIINEYPELDGIDFISWSYTNYGGCYIAIPVSVDNLNNIRKYIEFTKNWFKS